MADARSLRDKLWVYAERMTDSAAREVERETIADAPDGPPRVGGGPKLRSTILATRPSRRGTGFASTIVAAAPQALFTEKGTRPHVIRRRRAPALVFYWKRGPSGPGVYAFTKVNHPGTPAQNWFFAKMADRWNRALLRARGSVHV